MPTTTERKNRDAPMTSEELKAVYKMGMILVMGANVFMLVSFLLVSYEVINLYPKKMNEDMLKGFAARTEYALRYQTLLVAWLLANVLLTIYHRFSNKALNPLNTATEPSVGMINRILTNSFESITISVFSQLIFVTFAEPITVLKYIPLINIIQFIGRIAFFAGYPLKRGFGFSCTLMPSIILTGYNLFKLGEFVLGN